MHAKPNLNGNTPADFIKHGKAVLEAAQALRTAVSQASGDCLHGRNYQTVDTPRASRDADHMELLTLYRHLETLETWGKRILLAGLKA